MLYWIITCLVVMLLINQGTGEEEWKKWFNRNTEENGKFNGEIALGMLIKDQFYSGKTF